MDGPFVASNGDVISSALAARPVTHAGKNVWEELRVVRGQITQVYTYDNPQNNPGGAGQYTLYDVAVYRQDGSTEIIRRCRMGQPGWGGGIFDFLETNQGSMGPQALDFSVDSSAKPGNFVILAFLEAQKTAGGTILAAFPHSSPLAVAGRPTQAQGKRIAAQFQGLSWVIAADGSLTVTFNGPLSSTGAPTTGNGPTVLQMDGQGNVNVSNNAGQSVAMNRAAKTVAVTNGPLSVVMDNGAQKITVKGPTVFVDAAQMAVIESPRQIVLAAPAVQVASPGIQLGGPPPAGVTDGGSGGSEPLQPLVLGDTWQGIMQSLIQAIASITVICAGEGQQSSTPVNAAQIEAIAGQLATALSRTGKVGT